MQAFDCKKVSRGASGTLQQEFCALELLDHITCLQYTGKLPACVTGDTWKDLIASFWDWKEEHFILQGVHKSIQWSKSDPYIEVGIIEIRSEERRVGKECA